MVDAHCHAWWNALREGGITHVRHGCSSPLDGAASAPPPIVVRRTAAHLLRHTILLDFQCAFATDCGGAKPSKWRPATAAAFAKRWEKLCTRANGRPRFHGLIETPRDTSP